MNTSIYEITRQYLNGDISLNALREWVELNDWALTGLEEGLADEIEVALVHVADGFATEDDFRDRIAAYFEKLLQGEVRGAAGLVFE